MMYPHGPQRPRSSTPDAAGRATLLLLGIAFLVALCLLPLRQAHAADGLADLRAKLPTMTCADVARLNLNGAVDGGTVTIASSTAVAAGSTAAGFTVKAAACDVKGTIGPGNAQFEILLPTKGWTQRYLQVGCGGLCGSIGLNPPQAASCRPVTDGTLVMAATDMGHQGMNDGSWAAGKPQAIIDFAYRSEHALAQLSKALIRKFYGQAASYAYFDGCSDGGREALMEAQRYPGDFDGIAAGAPANDLVVQNTYHHGWNVVANQDANGKFILLANRLPLVHQAVLNACDKIDGLADGILDDPRACGFDPATLVCAAGSTDTTNCLTAAEAAVVRRLHDGPVDANGRHLEQPIAHEWGSELLWSLFIPATADGPSASANFALPFLRYLAFQNAQNPNYQLSDLQFTVPYFWQTVQSSRYLSALDPDLSQFERRGGKLLLWHGWEDQHITPQSTLDYYRHMKAEMGARRVDGFASLYLFPGVGHCGGGDGPNTFDVLTPLMAWVESSVKPGKIVASLATNGTVTRTRPVFPYPAVARYIGAGSTDDAANFTAMTPTREPGPGYDWVGAPLYRDGNEAACRAQGTQLQCTGGRFLP